MNVTEQSCVSTGKAAELCSVKRDTVLKWIRRGRLEASQTAGGHYRIDVRELEKFIPRRTLGRRDAEVRRQRQSLHCWEFFGGNGQERAECQSCVAYQAGAKWCFRLRELARNAGNSFCAGPEACEDCAYYRHVTGLPARVLVITGNMSLLEEFSRPEEGPLEIRVATNGYEASAVLAGFHPGFILLDAEIQEESAVALIENLAADIRLHGPRVILTAAASPPRRVRSIQKHEAVVGVLSKPLSARSLSTFIEDIPTDHLPPGSASPAVVTVGAANVPASARRGVTHASRTAR